MDLRMTAIILELSCQGMQAQKQTKVLSQLPFPFTQTSIASQFSTGSLWPAVSQEDHLCFAWQSLLSLEHFFFLGKFIYLF